jgi:hypothetical protein
MATQPIIAVLLTNRPQTPNSSPDCGSGFNNHQVDIETF